MKFSEQWLRQWVNPPCDTAELAHLLTMAGLEVEAIEPVAGEFANVVVGQVQSIEPHPNADKLRVCQVSVGQQESLQIVCGAPNVTEGMKVPVALVGARLPGGLKIKKTKLRGVASSGMLCSASELGLAESSEGLMALPVDALVGEDLRGFLQLDDDSIELGLTPNRGDCLCIAGIAREVGVLTRCEVQVPIVDQVAIDSERSLPITIKAAADCPRYVGRVIEGIDLAVDTPLWMQEALRRSGLRSLGPAVDVTNYVLLELGQPMHAFDLGKLQGGIQVRHAQEGESLTLLDGQTIDLTAGSLLIADEDGPLALAGIMGGAESAVSGETQDIFLESAYFNPLAIAGRARSYGLHTDASHRYERGVDPQLQRHAMERATDLLMGIAGGKAGPVIEICSEENLPQRADIVLRRARIPRVLGTEIADEVIEDILGRLGMSVVAADDSWSVTPPGFRFDVSIEEDLIEELARIHGYANLPSTHPSATAQMLPQQEGRVSLSRVQSVLIDRGYQEAITYSFVAPELQRQLDPEAEEIRLSNPISEEMSVMRTSLWPGLVEILRYNLNRQQSRVRLFESGLKFMRQANELKQEKYIAGIISGNFQPEQWATPGRRVDFFDVKGDVEALLATTGDVDNFSFESAGHPALHPGQCARIVHNGAFVGWLGALHPQVEKSLGLSQVAYVFELAMSCFEKTEIPHFDPISRFPAIRRDFAVVIDRQHSAAELKKVVRESAGPLLKDFDLFDVYEGEGVDSGRKSIAFGLTFQDQSRTLDESDIEDVLVPILDALSSKLGATLRE